MAGKKKRAAEQDGLDSVMELEKAMREPRKRC
jgi:hypothetical protein